MARTTEGLMLKNINQVDIKITRAEVTSVRIGLKDGEWQMTISGRLMSETGQEVTDFTYATESWNDVSKIDFPIEALGPARELIMIAEPVIIKKIQGHFRALGDGK